MRSHDAPEEPLFSYGTLQRPEIQLATFGRRLEGKRDVLTGYRLGRVAIEDPEAAATEAAAGQTHYRNLEPTGATADAVEGTVLLLTSGELERSDAYEAEAQYVRIRVTLASGLQAWAYLRPKA